MNHIISEALLAIIFKEIHKVSFAKALIDINDTLVDSKTGADACLYNMESQILILGESKFYSSYNKGMQKILNDFSKKIKNKIDSAKTAFENNDNSKIIILKNLDNEYDCDFLSYEDFFQNKLIFAGFNLHEKKQKR